MSHYLITGHTGFKGAWLIFLLKSRGHDVSGLALNPVPGSIFARANLNEVLIRDFRIDVRDRELTVRAIQAAQPDFVVHLAAQALVREGYRNPLATYETNVLGTLNVLEAVGLTESVKAQLIVTTDKVYLDQGSERFYVENDPIGGHDPYSASKAMADILAGEFLAREGAKPGAVARAGNVIGAGDVSDERLIPDIVGAIENRGRLVLRYPDAKRPWQHVLDCLDGYLRLLHATAESGLNGPFNFGPQEGATLSVRDVVRMVQEELDLPLEAVMGREQVFHESPYLALDSSKARSVLGWEEAFNLERALEDAVTSLSGLDSAAFSAHFYSAIDRWSRLQDFNSPDLGR